MASTYSPSLRLELMATGDQSGTWGDTTNVNLGTLLEQSITGYLSKAMADANQTLTSLNGASDEARNMVVEVTGALTGTKNVVVPTAEKIYLAKNSTTGGFAVTFKTTAGTGIAVYPGQSRWVVCDGTNVIDGDVPKFIDSEFLLADQTDVTKLAAFQLSGLATGQTRTYTLVDRSGTLLLSGGVLDTQLTLQDDGDATKQAQFNASGIPTATTRTYDLPYYSGTLSIVSDIRGQIYGLVLSNNVADATNDIDISAGATVDSTGAVSMLLASSLTKRLDAAWAVGTNQGGLDTGAVANGTYHVYIIRRPDTGVVDAIFSISPAGPTLPANYTQFRRVGSIVRLAGTISAFRQVGDQFKLVTGVTVRSDTAAFATAALSLNTVPTGINVQPILRNSQIQNTAGNVSTSVGDGDNSSPMIILSQTLLAGELDGMICDGLVTTDVSGRINYNVTIGSGTLTANVLTCFGWNDKRGRLA